jgi:hypothetical protein
MRFLCYDGAIMMVRAQITLEPEFHRRARRRAGDLGVSFAEYVRTLVIRDLSHSVGARAATGIESIFDLGNSGGSNIAKDKHSMIAAAFDAEATASVRRRPRSR